MTDCPQVSIVILNWNGAQDTIKCLESLQGIQYSNFEIVLVDNGSKDDSVKKIHKWAHFEGKKVLTKSAGEIEPLKANETKGYDFTFILNDTNAGFAGGNNLAVNKILSISNPSYILLLNSDTLVTKSFLTDLVEACQKDKKIGSAQPLLIRFDKKTIDSLGIEMKGYRIFDTYGGKESSILPKMEESKEIFGACGAAALYRVDLIKRIGLFDENLFATFEDFDLAWRIRLAGFKSVLARDSVVYHRGGVSRFRQNHVIFDMRSYLGAKNPLVMFNRYYPISFKIIATSFVRFGVALISALKNRRTKEFLSIVWNFPKERKKISKNRLLREIRRKWLRR